MENRLKGDSAEHKKIISLLKNNQFERVIDLSESLLQENPRDPKAMLLISLAQAGLGNDRAALAQADQAGQIQPEFKFEVLASLGKYYASKSRFFRALMCFNSALAIKSSSEVERQVAAIYLARGQTARAKMHYEKLLDNSPDYLNLARIYLKERKFAKAIQFAKQAVSGQETSPGGSLLLASAYLLNNQLSDAKKIYQTLRSQVPDLLPTYHALGLIETAQKNYHAALEVYRAALKRAPRLREALIGRAAVLHAQGQLQPAETDTFKAINSDPSDFLPHLTLGNILISTGNDERATRAYQRASALFIDFGLPQFSVSDYFTPNQPNAPVQFTLANIYYREGLYQFAIEVLNAAEKKSLTENPFLALLKARALLRLGEEDRSEYMIQNVIERHPQTVSGLLEMGDLAIFRKDYRRAAEYYRKAVKMAPGVVRLRLILGGIYSDMQQADRAISTYKAAVSVFPKSSILYNQLAWKLAENQNNLKEAKTYARKAVKYAPDDPNVKDTLAWIYYRQGEHKEALKIYS